LNYLLCDLIGALVFPESEYFPPSISQFRISLYIPLDVTGQLCLPILGIVSEYPAAMFRAIVPKTPINEDGNPCPCEDDGGLSAEASFRCHRDAVTQALLMQASTHG